MQTVEQALALIPGRRELLNNIDDRLAHVIRYVERVLVELKPGVPSEVSYETEDGAFVLSFHKHKGGWCIMHGIEADDDHDTPLVSASRQARAEVFIVPKDGHQSPLEQLIVAVAESLDDFAKERSPSLDRALHISAVLERAGFPDPLE
jgi:hypothetical protein